MDNALNHPLDAESEPLARAQILFNLGRYREVLDTLRAHIRDVDIPVMGYGLCIISFCELGDFTSARNLAQEGLTDYPEDADLHMGLGLALFGQSLVQAALEEARRAAALEPKRAGTHEFESWVLHEMGLHADSIKSIRRALALDPNNANFHYRLAKNLSLRSSTAEEALATVNAGLALEPNHAGLLGILAELEPQRTTFHLRDLGLAIAFTLLVLGIKFLTPADWQWTYQSLAVPATWFVGIALFRFTWPNTLLLFGFNFFNSALGFAPNDAAAAWSLLAESNIEMLFGMSVAPLVMAFYGVLIMGFLRSTLTISFASLRKFVQAFLQARRANVAPSFLREQAHSRNTWFNLAGCLPPLIAPLLISSWDTLLIYLLCAQSSLLYGASRLWWPKGQQVNLFTALVLHSLPLIFFLIVLPEHLDRLLLGIVLALVGFFTADLLRGFVDER